MRLGWYLASLVALTGCSAIINDDPSRLGGGSDGSAQTQDGGSTTGRDSGTPRRDGGTPRPDAGMPRPDSGMACTPGQHCEGDTLVSCAGGVETRTNCQDLSAFCDANQCQEWVCTPNEQQCTFDGTGVAVCDARGSGQTTTPCALGCNRTTNTCVIAPLTCAGLPTINLGDEQQFNLCLESDDDTYVPSSDGCGANTRANAGDRTFVFTLEHATDVVIELTDADPSAAIDTVVYVRRACDDASTQVVCDDDVPCTESTVPGGCSGYEVRQSRIRMTLDAGPYYIVADAFTYDTTAGTRYRCGNVRLRVTTP